MQKRMLGNKDDDLKQMNDALSNSKVQGARYSELAQKMIDRS